MSKTGLAALAFAVTVASSAALADDGDGSDDLHIDGESKDLVVLLHAFSSEAASLDQVRAALKDPGLPNGGRFADADILAPDLPFGAFSMARPSEVLAGLIKKIDRAWASRIARGGKYERIFLVGHSMGALYARKLYVMACGENEEAVFEPELKTALADLGADPLDKAREWAAAVDRLVLLAGMNRGWSISHHMSLSRAALMSLGVAAGHVISWVRGRFPIIFSIRRGSSFITQLRIQWLAMRERAVEKGVGGKLTVQLLGTVDDLVSPRDNIDLVSGHDFVYLDVAESGHADVIEMDQTPAGRGRAATFATVISKDPEALKAEQVIPADEAIAQRREVTDVVFVIHGIRDEGFWTQKIARRVIAKARDTEVTIKRCRTEGGEILDECRKKRLVVSETSSYGYFPMLSFLHPGARQEKVEWLMDQYTQALATYPEARFSYVGHSHGTYLLAKALEDYPAVKFENVVFAGSVVRHGFDWSEHIPRQAKSVLNFVATSDWVVAFFPKALQTLRIQDLGSAGHDGFKTAPKHDQVYELDRQYVSGQHSAALQEGVWDSIADFVLEGRFEPPPKSVLSSDQVWWVKYPAMIAPLIWVLGVLGVGGILWGLIWGLNRMDVAQWAKTLWIVGYVWLIWTVLTRV